MTTSNVSTDAIEIEKMFHLKVIEIQKELMQCARKLTTTFDENQDGLGAHAGSIYSCIDQLVTDSNNEKPVKVLKKTLKQSIEIRKDLREINEHKAATK